MNNKEITLSDAIQVVKERLRKDEDYYDSWVANIACSIHDEYYSRGKSYLEGEELHEVFNKGAERFLKLLIS